MSEYLKRWIAKGETITTATLDALTKEGLSFAQERTGGKTVFSCSMGAERAEARSTNGQVARRVALNALRNKLGKRHGIEVIR